MADQANPLAGMQQPEEAPQDAADLPVLQVAPGVSAPALAGQVADAANTNAAANPNPKAPGGWARALMGGVMDALSGFGAAGKVPEGAGALYGVGAASRQYDEMARQKQARQDALKQQQFEDQKQTQQMTREEVLSRATIAHENAATAHDQMLNANLSYESRQKNITNGKVGIAPYEQAGAQVLQEGLDSDDAQELIRTKKLDPTQVHAFPTGEKPILDANGKEQTDQAGNPITRPTYTVIGDVPQVTLNADQAKLISENTAYKFPEGTKMSGTVYGTVIQQATSAATAAQAINETRAEQGLKELDTQQKVSAAKMLPDWNTALAKAGNDPFKALQYMQADPQLKQKYPDAATLVQSLYGGPKAWQDLKDKQIELQEKQREDDLKAKEKATDFTGNPDATDPVAFRDSLEPNARGVVDMIGQGRAPLNNPGYLLARKPEIMGAVEKAYPGFDGSKVSSYQAAYKDYTSGKVSEQLTSGATALEHLNELQQLNTLKSRIPGTADNQAYQNKVDTVASELARFYGNSTEQGIKSYRDTLNSYLNRGAAITTQAKSMGDRLDNLETEWKNAAPSPAYQAPMPGISQSAKQARAKLDPDYATKIGANVPAGISPGSIQMAVPGGQPHWIPLDKVEAAKKLGAAPVQR